MEHEHQIKISTKKIWRTSAIILAILLIISVIFNIRSIMPSMSAKEAGESTIDYLNKYVLQGATANLVSVERATNELYNIKLEVGGNQYDSYVTTDGKLLFPQALDMEMQPEVPEQEEPEEEQAAQPETPKTDKPNVKMFVMSFCPYGQQAENGLGPALAALGTGKVEFEPHFVIYSNYGGGGPQYCIDEESKYCSMHGIQELNEDVRQLCVWKYEQEKFWDYVNGINSKCSYNNVDACWENVAEENDVDTEKVKTCFEEEALDLLEAEVQLNQEFGVRGSPSVFINDASYSGGRSPEAYKQGICSAFNTPPEECGETLSESGEAAAGSC